MIRTVLALLVAASACRRGDPAARPPAAAPRPTAGGGWPASPGKRRAPIAAWLSAIPADAAAVATVRLEVRAAAPEVEVVWIAGSGAALLDPPRARLPLRDGAGALTSRVRLLGGAAAIAARVSGPRGRVELFLDLAPRSRGPAPGRRLPARTRDGEPVTR